MKSNDNGFSWDINQTPIYDLNGKVINGYKEITRNDDNSSIAVMKKSYTPMTTQQFSDTANAIAEQVGGKVGEFQDWQNGDTYNMGRKKQVITAQIELTEAFEIAGSKIQGYLTLGVGFDGGRSFFVGHTNSYMRCTNRFGSIIQAFTSRLTKNNMVRVEDIVNSIQLYTDYEKSLYNSFNKMQSVKIDEKLISECVARLVNMTDEERLDSKLISTQKLNKMDDIMASIRTETAELGSNGWGLFNGVTHYTTHVMKGEDSAAGDIYGAKNKANHKAMDLILSV